MAHFTETITDFKSDEMFNQSDLHTHMRFFYDKHQSIDTGFKLLDK